MRQRSESYNPDGLTRREREVLRLWDEGHSLEQIAELTGTPRDKTGDIVSALTEGNETRRHLAGMAQGSAALLAAMGAS
jgi:hypothetical protein